MIVLGLVGRLHVPVESVLEPEVVRVVFYLLKLGRLAGDGSVGLHEMGFRFGHEPVWKRLRYVIIFLQLQLVKKVEIRETTTHAVQHIKDQTHGYAKLLKVEVAVIVDISQIPDFF